MQFVTVSPEVEEKRNLLAALTQAKRRQRRRPKGEMQPASDNALVRALQFKAVPPELERKRLLFREELQTQRRAFQKSMRKKKKNQPARPQ